MAEILVTPMFVNCPNIGPVDKNVVNQDKKKGFLRHHDSSFGRAGLDFGLGWNSHFPKQYAYYLLLPDGTLLGNTTTTMMGAFEYEVKTAQIPHGTELIKVMFKDTLIRTITVVEGEASDAASIATVGTVVSAVLGLFIALFW
jgi:hypothetical protein